MVGKLVYLLMAKSKICWPTKLNPFQSVMTERVSAAGCPGFLIFLALTFFLIHVLKNENKKKITFKDAFSNDMKKELVKTNFHCVYRK